ncbi:MAG: zf-HC2 domain-containing protein [Desulfobacterium sp.]
MACNEIIKLLTVWVDGELPVRQAHGIETHLQRCPACRRAARDQRQMAVVLNELPAIAAPAGFSRKTLRAFRSGLERPNLVQWWRQLNFIMRGAVCGAALAGLLFGAVMGTSLSDLNGDSQTIYHSLYASTGIFL